MIDDASEAHPGYQCLACGEHFPTVRELLAHVRDPRLKEATVKRWSFHFCALDRECRRDIPGPPCWRIRVGTPWGNADIALRPGDRYCRIADDGGIRTRWFLFSR